ncbi:MAG: CHAD domain-containing protein [Terracidiphilus sp.]|jgi:CHAD domain-containing protein
MNSGQIRHNPQVRVAAPQLPQLTFESWRSLLDACRHKPSRKHVHGLRVATLRLQAQLDSSPGSHSVAQAARRWNKSAEKLRASLSAVRETDVYRAKLSGLCDTLATPEGYAPRSSRISLRQIEELDEWLARERKIAAKELIADLKHRQERLDRLSVELESAQAFGHSLIPVSSLSGVFKMFADAVAEFPKLDMDCLHDFRKRMKNVRYLAELFASTDPQAGRMAESLKLMQGVVGEWHDWEELAQLASRRLRKRHKDGALTELLKTLAEESLEKALECCRCQTAELLGQIAITAPPLRLVAAKPPVRSLAPVTMMDERRLA